MSPPFLLLLAVSLLAPAGRLLAQENAAPPAAPSEEAAASSAGEAASDATEALEAATEAVAGSTEAVAGSTAAVAGSTVPAAGRATEEAQKPTAADRYRVMFSPKTTRDPTVSPHDLRKIEEARRAAEEARRAAEEERLRKLREEREKNRPKPVQRRTVPPIDRRLTLHGIISVPGRGISAIINGETFGIGDKVYVRGYRGYARVVNITPTAVTLRYGRRSILKRLE